MARYREYVPDPPAPPAHLTPEQAELFTQAATFLVAKGVWGAADIVALEHYAVATTTARAIDAEIAKRGAVDGKGRVSGLLAHSRIAHTNLRSWIRALGLSPAGRRDLPRGLTGGDGAEDSPLAKLLAEVPRPRKAQ